ncbi:nodal homolog 2-A [Oryctolagus cuniculus]|uniref:nodal homolog 2-A n=1 Tax=Oryctolagus cuniculus TaxID=9986 RepID=UPI003879A1AC
MEGSGQGRGCSWLLSGLLALGFLCMHFSWVEPLDCAARILPSRVNEIFVARQHGFTLTSKSAQFLHSYWLLYFEAAPFVGISLVQLWAWVPNAPHATELILEFKDHRRGPSKFLLGSFPVIFSSYHSETGSLLEIYCLLTYWMEVVPTLLTEEKIPSTDVADVRLNECSSTQGKRDMVLLFISSAFSQPPLFHLPYVQEPFITNVEQLILGTPGQNPWDVDPGQTPLPAEKLCHLVDRKVNLHRATWGECIVAPKTFSSPHCQGTCLALNSEFHQPNLECHKRDAPTCPQLFRACVPTKVRLLSLMVQDDEHKMSVHHVNTSLIEKCGCS